MKPLRTAVIGIGGMAGAHAALLHANERIELTCVCDIVEQKAKEQAQKLACDYETDSAALLARQDVDAVLIGVPNALHPELARAALQAGKHVAVEYPVTQTVEEYESLTALAAQRNLVLSDWLTPLHEVQAVTMRSLVGEVGRVVSQRSAYFAGGRNTWYVDPKLRGNFFSGLTIHQIVYFNIVMDRLPVWVQGTVQDGTHPGGGRWSAGTFLCGYEDGATAWNDWGMGFDETPSTWEWVVEGTAGRLVYERPPREKHRIRLTKSDGEDRIVEMEKQGKVHAPFANRFVEQVLDGAEPLVPPDVSRATVRIFQAAQESADTGCRVTLPAP